MKTVLALLAGHLGLAVLFPDPLHAWGPGTHIALGEMVLGALHLLPGSVRLLLEKYPIHYLYGSVAADISFAKKYVPEGRHCHHWPVGEEIFDTADTDALRAVGLGYLSHLAADTIAHNVYVPRRLLLTSTTSGIGHTYWEHRMDVHLGREYLEKARRLVLRHDHQDADALFDQVLSATLFSFRTNRRIFRGMIQVQGDARWQTIFDQVLRNSRFAIRPPLIDRYLSHSFDSIIDYLALRGDSRPATLDPTGEDNLRLAKKARRAALAEGWSEKDLHLLAKADEFFPFPEVELRHWREREALPS